MYKRIEYDINKLNNKNIIINKTLFAKDNLQIESKSSPKSPVDIIDCSIIINEDIIYDIKINLHNYPFKQPGYKIYPTLLLADNDNNDEICIINGNIIFREKTMQQYPCCGEIKRGFQTDLEQIIKVLQKYHKQIITQELHNDMNNLNNLHNLHNLHNLNITEPNNQLISIVPNSLRKYNNKVTLRLEIIIENVNYEIFMETISYPSILLYRIYPIPKIAPNDMIAFPCGWVSFKDGYVNQGISIDLHKLITLVIKHKI